MELEVIYRKRTIVKKTRQQSPKPPTSFCLLVYMVALALKKKRVAFCYDFKKKGEAKPQNKMP